MPIRFQTRTRETASSSTRRTRPVRAALPFVLAAALAGAGCDESLSTLAGPTPNLAPTFSSIQREIIQSTSPQGCVNCHSTTGRQPAGGLNLAGDAAYGNLVNAPSRFKAGAVRVVPGDPENSYLIHKLEGRAGIVGLRMPFNGPPFLTDGQILVIRRWIELGANND
jgi:hypothetical protein